MIDIKDLRDSIDEVEKSLARRGYSLNKDKFIDLDGQRKSLQIEVESLQSDRKNLSNDFGKLKLSGEDTEDLKKKIDSINDSLKSKNESLNLILDSINSILLDIPNIPHESTPDGKNESENVVLRTVGKITSSNKVDHIDLTTKIDTDLAAKLAGSRFAVLKGSLAKLQRALISLMLDTAQKNGYEEYYLPYMANKDSLIGTGNLPKFEEDLFKTSESLYLIPTAEVPLTNLYRDKILNEDDLPIYMVAHTPCFRSEAGSYGKDTKGIIRQHQFEKVELVHITKPDDAESSLSLITSHAEKIMEDLEIPYQTILLSSGDLGFSSCKTFDIEAWFPSQECYREVSSCSLFSDFQSRRLNIKFKNSLTKKKEYVCTLNGSGLAIGRTMAALIENHTDGKIINIPKVLQPITGFDVIKL